MDNDILEIIDDDSLNDNANKYLSFFSDGLQYAITANFVTDIITNYEITLLPRVPHFIKGIMNFRGQIIPIIDIRARMGRATIEYSQTSCVIVLDVNTVLIGIVVDSVSRVIDLTSDMITPVPNNTQELVYGIAKFEDNVNLLLDCESLVQTN